MKFSWLAIVLLLLPELPVSAASGSGGGGGGGGGNVASGVLSLKISDEIAPPGGVVQMKFSVTEPRPIIRGTVSMSYDTDLIDSFLGIAVFSPNGDASGTASWQNGVLHLELNSPGQDLGSVIDYPIVTIAVRLKPTAIPGTVSFFNMDLSQSTLLDVFGSPYPAEIKPGTITVGGTLSVYNVSPGGGLIAAGTPVTITGSGFDAKTDVRINTNAKYSFSVISPNEIRVIPQSAVDLTSARIVLKNSKETTTYYSYLRPAIAPAVGDSAVTRVKPVLPTATLRDGLVGIGSLDAGAVGIALENPSAAAAAVTADLYDPLGNFLATSALQVPAWSSLNVDLATSFPGVAVKPSVVRVRSATPIQAMGLSQQVSTGQVVPLPVTIVAK
jgi:hypothetical protein